MFQKILLSYDGSEPAHRAMIAAAKIARSFDATVTVIHTPQIDTPSIMATAYVGAIYVTPTDTDIAEAGAFVKTKAETDAAALGLTLEAVHISRGDPARNALQQAEDIGADLIIMGRRGLGGFASLALGSVSQAVTHGAKCAVLTVP